MEAIIQVFGFFHWNRIWEYSSIPDIPSLVKPAAEIQTTHHCWNGVEVTHFIVFSLVGGPWDTGNRMGIALIVEGWKEGRMIDFR